MLEGCLEHVSSENPAQKGITISVGQEIEKTSQTNIVEAFATTIVNFLARATVDDTIFTSK